MPTTITPIARKNIPVSTTTSIAVSYTKLSDSTPYTPVKDDVCVVILNGTKSTTGNSTITLPAGWDLASQPPGGGLSNGSINDTGAILVRKATGTSADSPTISVTSAAWQAETYVLPAGSVDLTVVPKDPTSLPQSGSTSTASGSNPGVALATSVPNELVLSALILRGPAGVSNVVWSGTTVDQAMTGGSNNFLSTALTTVASPGTVQPSATWTGGTGTASTIMSIGFAPLVATPATTRKVRVAGAATTATRKVRVAGVATTATRKVRVAGVAT